MQGRTLETCRYLPSLHHRLCHPMSLFNRQRVCLFDGTTFILCTFLLLSDQWLANQVNTKYTSGKGTDYQHKEMKFQTPSTSIPHTRLNHTTGLNFKSERQTQAVYTAHENRENLHRRKHSFSQALVRWQLHDSAGRYAL